MYSIFESIQFLSVLESDHSILESLKSCLNHDLSVCLTYRTLKRLLKFIQVTYRTLKRPLKFIH